MNVFRQALTLIRKSNHYSRFYRADRGKKVFLFTDTHYLFYKQYKKKESKLNNEKVQNIRLR
jgi:hypothetical protein